MIFTDTGLPGAKWIELDYRADARGGFVRTFCAEEFARAGISFSVVQSNVSVNAAAGTLRGMHYQCAPHAEDKLILCTSGAFYDVIVDLRRDSPTFRRWKGFTLRADRPGMLYIPRGFAHGFQTLADQTNVLYYMGSAYAPGSARGFRFDDPMIGVQWPLAVTRISEKDLSYPALTESEGF